MTITIDDVTYEAESHAEASRIIRKAERERERERKINNERSAQALLKCKAKACDLYERILQNRDCPRAWIAYTPDDTYGKSLCQRHASKPYTTTLDVEGLRVEIEIWNQNLTHVICNGSGFVWGFFATDKDGLTRFYTIAQHEGTWTLLQCFGITLNWFNKPTTSKE